MTMPRLIDKFMAALICIGWMIIGLCFGYVIWGG